MLYSNQQAGQLVYRRVRIASLLVTYAILAAGFPLVPSVAGDAGSLAEPSIEATSRLVNATATYTFSFQLTNPWPSDGSLVLEFPSGFTFLALDATATADCSSGDFVPTADQPSPGSVQIQRRGGDACPEGTLVRILLEGLKNPKASDPALPFSMRTTDMLGAAIDEARLTIAIDPPMALAAASAQPAASTRQAGDRGRFWFNFTTQSTIPAAGQVSFRFDPVFDVASAAGGTCTTMDGSFTTSVSGQTVTLRRGDAQPIPVPPSIEPAGSQTCSVDNIGNPQRSGAFPVRVHTQHADGVDIDAATASATVLPGILSPTPPTLSSATLLEVATYTFNIELANPWPSEGRLEITFPQGVSTASAQLGTFDGTCTSLGTATLDRADQVVSILRTGDGSDCLEGSTITVEVQDLQNPGVPGPTGDFQILTANETTIDLGTAPGVVIDTATIVSAALELATLKAGAMDDAVLTFTPTNPIPEGGQVRIDFGAGFDTMSVDAVECPGLGELTLLRAGSAVTLTRTDTTTVVPPSEQTCTFHKVVNPPQSGPGPAHTLDTLTAAGTVLDTTSILGEEFLPGDILDAAATTTNARVGAEGTYTVEFTTTNPIPTNGLIILTFPDELTLTQPPTDPLNLQGPFGTCTLAGTETVTVTGKQAKFTRSGGGIADPGTYTCSLRGVRNPSTPLTTGLFTVTTNRSAPSLTGIDTGTAPGVDIITGALQGLSTEAPQKIAGTLTTYHFNFTTSGGLPADGKLIIVFPETIGLAGVSASSSTCTFTGGVTTTKIQQTVTLSRTANIVVPANPEEPGAYGCAISGVRNPQVSGPSGTFAIETRTATGEKIDGGTSPSLTILPAALSGLSATPADARTGAVTDYTFGFTTKNPLPANGQIRIAFPAGFALDAVTTASCASMAGNLTVNVVDRVVVLSRTATDPAGPGTHTCTVAGVRNPRAIGATPTIPIETRTDQATPIDQGDATGPTITKNVLTALLATPQDLTAGAMTTYAFDFTTPNGIDGLAQIRIVLPTTLTLGTVVGHCASMEGNFQTTRAGFNITLTRQGTAFEPAAAERCTLSGIQNPSKTGPTGTFLIETRTPAGILTDDGFAASITILPGVLGAVSATADDLAPGAADVAYTFSFTTVNAIPADGKIQFAFPDGYSVTTAEGTCSTIAGPLLASVTGRIVTLTRAVPLAPEAPGLETCIITKVTNPRQGGPTGAFPVRTLTTTNAIVDAGVAPALVLGAAELLETTVALVDSARAGDTTSATVGFTGETGWPGDGRLIVGFPTEFTLGNVDVEATTGCTSGTFTATRDEQNVTVTRAGGSVCPAGAPVSVTLTNVTNPPVSGTTAPFAMATWASDDIIMDFDQDQPASATIDPNALTAAEVEPLNAVVGTTGTTSLTFTLTNPLPEDGIIEIVFPDGFGLQDVGPDAASCASMDGSLATNVDGQAVTISRAGGTAQSAGSAETCKLRGVTNPATSGAIGGFVIRTLWNDSRVIDQSPSLPAQAFDAAPTTDGTLGVSSTFAGALVDVTVELATTTRLPADGKLRIELPAGFDATQATQAACDAWDGGVEVVGDDEMIMVVRDGSGTDLGPMQVSCLVNNVRNPAASGGMGDATVALVDVHDVTIEAGTLSAPSLQPALLTDAEVALLIPRFGRVTWVDVAFTTINTLPQDGIVAVTFPEGFDVSSAAGGTCFGFSGGILTTVQAQTVSFVRDGTGQPAPIGPVVCRVGDIRNPLALGPSGSFDVQTQTSDEVPIDQAANVPGPVIGYASLVSASVSAADLTARAETTYTFDLTTSVVWPADGTLEIELPPDTQIGPIADPVILGCADIGTIFVVIASQTVQLVRFGDGEPCAPTTLTFTLGPFTNPATSGRTQPFIFTFTGELGFAPGLLLTPSQLSTASVVLADVHAGSPTTATVTFQGISPVPSDGRILVSVPAGFGLEDVSLVSCSFDGGLLLDVTQNTVIVRRDGTGTPAASEESCSFGPVRNPTISGPSGPFDIAILNAAAARRDEALNVPGPLIEPGGISLTGLSSTGIAVAETATYNIQVETSNPWPSDGRLDVVFPPGFNLDDATAEILACVGDVGNVVASVSTHAITFTRDGEEGQCEPGELSLAIEDVKHPPHAGTFAPIEFRTYTTADIDRGESSPLLIVPGTLLNPTVEPSTRVADQAGSWTISFNLLNPLPADGAVNFRLPIGFRALGAGLEGCTGMSGEVDIVSSTVGPSGTVIVLKRDGGGTNVLDGQIVCTLLDITNPATHGTYGTYSIWTSDAAANLIDRSADIPGHTIVAADITGVVSAASVDAGDVTSYRLQLTTATRLPSEAQLAITFPEGFDVSGASSAALHNCDTTPEPLIIAIDGSTVTVVREGDDPCPLSIDVRIEGIRNPRISGPTGPFAVASFGAGPLDVGTLPGVDLMPGPIGDIAITPSNPTVGATTSYLFELTPFNPWPANGELDIQFPTEFDLTGVDNVIMGDECVEEMGTAHFGVVDSVVVVIRDGDGSDCTGPIVLLVEGVRNPPTAGPSGSFILLTWLDGIIDAAETPDVLIVTADIQNALVDLTSTVAGEMSDAAFSFSTASDLPSDGALQFVFPPGFQVADATLGSCNGFDGGFVLQATSSVATLVRDGTGSIAVPGDYACTIQGVRNAPFAGPITFTLRTTDAELRFIDETTFIASQTIEPAALGAPIAFAADLRAGTRTAYDFHLPLTNPLPADGQIKIAFPPAFNIDGVGAAALVGCSGAAGGFDIVPLGRQLDLLRVGDGGSCDAGTVVLHVEGIQNPGSLGFTPGFNLTTTTNDGSPIDLGVAPGVDIIPGLEAVSVTGSNLVAGALGSYTFAFTTFRPIGATESMSFLLPTGFTTVDASGTCASMDGTVTTLRNGLTVTLQRTGTSTSQAVGVETCTITGLRNPAASGPTGTFGVVLGSGPSAQRGDASAVTLTPGALRDVAASGTSQQPAASTTWTFVFGTQSAIPPNGAIRVVFPAGFSTSTGGTTICDITNVANEGTRVLGDNEVVCALGSSGLAAGSVTVRLTHIGNPTSAGTTGTFLLETLDDAGRVQERDGSNTESIAAGSTTSTASSSSTGSTTSGATGSQTTSGGSSGASTGGSTGGGGSGGGGGGAANPTGTTTTPPASTSASPPPADVSSITLTAAAPPAGALAKWQSSIPSAKAGTTVTVETSDQVIRGLKLGLGSTVLHAPVEITVWPAGSAPSGIPTVPAGVYVAFFVEIHVGSGSDPVDVATLSLSLPSYAVSDAQRALLLHQVGTHWKAEGRLALTGSGDGRMDATIATPCCSIFAVAFDLQTPQLDLVLTTASNKAITLQAVVADNTGIKEVQFYDDKTLVHVASVPPYQYTWPAGALSDTQLVHAVAVDHAGNNVTAIAAVEDAGTTLSVDEPSAFPFKPFLIFGGVFVVLLLVGVYMARRSRRGADEADDVDDPFRGPTTQPLPQDFASPPTQPTPQNPQRPIQAAGLNLMDDADEDSFRPR